MTPPSSPPHPPSPIIGWPVFFMDEDMKKTNKLRKNPKFYSSDDLILSSRVYLCGRCKKIDLSVEIEDIADHLDLTDK